MVPKLVPVPSKNMIPERDIDKPVVLECINLGITFGGLRAVEDFNFAIGQTEIAGLIGPNGAGKTTVFNLLTKVYQPTTGTILLNGQDTQNMDTAHVNRAGIARTFQNIRLFSNLTVEENVKVAMNNQMHYGMLSSLFRLPKLLERGEESPRTRPGAALHLQYGGSGQCQGEFAARTAPSAVWRSSAPSPPTRACSCWTSPPPV